MGVRGFRVRVKGLGFNGCKAGEQVQCKVQGLANDVDIRLVRRFRGRHVRVSTLIR